MKQKNIIIVSGYAGSGKDTLVDYIVENSKYKRYALADPVREAVIKIFALDDKTAEKYLCNPIYKNELIPGYNYSGRTMCQIVGNEMRELFYSEVWCDNLNTRSSHETHIIISDNRYPNEESYFRSRFNNVKTIRIERPSKNGIVGISNHPSESHVMDADIVIVNDSTLEDLYKKIYDLKL